MNAQIGRVISANAAFDRHSARFQARRVGQNARDNSITRVDTHQKRAYNDDISRPKFALMDPELTKTLPDYQTESGCADIMMHTMERYFTNGGNMELTDALAEGLLRTVMKNAVILHTDPANYEARAEVMWAGSLSHNGLTACGIASEPCNDILFKQWSKLMVNDGLNQAAAAFDLPYGGLTKPGPAYDKMVEAMQEVIDLSVLEGVNLPADNHKAFLESMAPTSIPTECPVCGRTSSPGAPPRWSSLQVSSAVWPQKHGMPTPANDFFYEKIREIEANYNK